MAKRQNYVDKVALYNSIVEWKKQTAERAEQGLPPKRMPEEIGKAIMKISEGIGSRPNFRNYTFVDEMIQDGIVDAVRSVNTFNPEKSQNPFGYFSQVIWYAFLGRIGSEKKIQKTKIDSMMDPTQDFFDQMNGDDHNIDRGELLDFYYQGKS